MKNKLIKTFGLAALVTLAYCQSYSPNNVRDMPLDDSTFVDFQYYSNGQSYLVVKEPIKVKRYVFRDDFPKNVAFQGLEIFVKDSVGNFNLIEDVQLKHISFKERRELESTIYNLCEKISEYNYDVLKSNFR